VLGNKGSILVGQFYAPVPNSNSSGPAVAVGSDGLTANSIRISTTATDLGTRFEVVRTGTGSITISAGQDVQLRNQFATIYTAGRAHPESAEPFRTGRFPSTHHVLHSATNPDQGQLGASQQFYGVTFTDEDGAIRRIPQWSLAGGEIDIQASRNIRALFRPGRTWESHRRFLAPASQTTG